MEGMQDSSIYLTQTECIMTVAEHRVVMEHRCHYRTNTKSWTPGSGEPPRDTSCSARSRHEALFGCLQTDGTARSRQTPSGSMADEHGRSAGPVDGNNTEIIAKS